MTYLCCTKAALKAIEEAESQSKEAAALLRGRCVHHAARNQHGTA